MNFITRTRRVPRGPLRKNWAKVITHFPFPDLTAIIPEQGCQEWRDIYYQSDAKRLMKAGKKCKVCHDLEEKRKIHFFQPVPADVSHKFDSAMATLRTSTQKCQSSAAGPIAFPSIASNTFSSQKDAAERSISSAPDVSMANDASFASGAVDTDAMVDESSESTRMQDLVVQTAPNQDSGEAPARVPELMDSNCSFSDSTEGDSINSLASSFTEIDIHDDCTNDVQENRDEMNRQQISPDRHKEGKSHDDAPKERISEDDLDDLLESCGIDVKGACQTTRNAPLEMENLSPATRKLLIEFPKCEDEVRERQEKKLYFTQMEIWADGRLKELRGDLPDYEYFAEEEEL